jgi:hypothetical protein
MAAVELRSVIELALQLSPRERLQLVERMVASVEKTLPTEDTVPASSEHWGQNLVRLLEELGPVDLVHPEIEDPVEWVKQIRREQDIERGLNWGQEE